MKAAPKKRRYDLGSYALGIEWGASVIGLTLLGVWLDRYLDTAPWALVICFSIGFVGGTYNFIRSARKAAHEAERRAREEGGET